MNTDRRTFLKQIGLGTASLVGAAALSASGLAEIGHADSPASHTDHENGAATGPPAAYTVFNPHRFLYEFDYGEVSRTAMGRTVRE